jgi:hypothetical protein
MAAAAPAAAPVEDGVMPFEGAHTMLSATCVRARCWYAVACYVRICVKAFLPGSDDSDSDEDHQGRTMATESELAPLEGAALSRFLLNPGAPSSFALLAPDANVAALIWKSDAARGFSTIS